MVCLSASTIDTALELIDVGRVVTKLPPPAPQFGFGGRAFNVNPTVSQKVPGVFLGETAQEAIDAIVDVLGGGKPHG
jgi:hypothetical protein